MAKDLSVLKDIYLDPEVEADLQNRLSRIEGHVRGIKRMLGEHASCEDLLIQLSAVRSALNQATVRLLENHMETCVAECVRATDASLTPTNGCCQVRVGGGLDQ